MPGLVIYKEFPDAESADAFAAMLAENRIDSVTEAPQKRDSFTDLYALQAPDLMYKVKVKPEDTDTINRIVENLAEAEYKSLPEGHYLLSYTAEELQQMIATPEEWSRADYAMARYILKQKGITYTDAELAEKKHSHISQVKQPKKAMPAVLIAGYILSLLSGVGIIIGWHLWMSYKKDSEGKNYYIYTLSSRRHGQIIFLISACSLILCLYLAIAKPDYILSYLDRLPDYTNHHLYSSRNGCTGH